MVLEVGGIIKSYKEAFGGDGKYPLAFGDGFTGTYQH